MSIMPYAANLIAGFAMPGFRAGVVSLRVNGMLYEGWESVDITRSVKQMAGEFSLKVSEQTSPGGVLPSWPIRVGDECQVLYSGIPVVTGHVNVYSPDYDATKHEVQIQGRSKTGDPCDCSAEAEISGGEMRQVNLEQMARKALKSYNIGVKVEADVSKKFDVVRVQPGETVHEWIERYARPGAVLPTDDELGNLRLLQVQNGGPVASLIEGVNILQAKATFRDDNRHSDYEVKGQDHGSGDKEFGKPVAQRRAQAKDPSIKRHRPLRMLNETKTSNEDARSRADWEAAARAGESVKAEVTVVDWCYAPGALWRPGDRVAVMSPMLRLNRILAIESVKFHQAESTNAVLSLVPVEALNPKAGGGGGSGGGGGGGLTGSNNDALWIDTKPTTAAA